MDSTSASANVAKIDLSVLVPVFNEAAGLPGTLERLRAALGKIEGLTSEIVCIDDGSTDGSAALLDEAAARGEIVLLRATRNAGYGASLKWGARRARGAMIAMIDADGTYPPERLADLVAEVRDRGADMAVGARTGAVVHLPLVRRPAKWLLTRLANYLSGHHIPDLNSGLRVLRREALLEHIRLLPDGFSLTTTITLALMTSGARVVYVPIDYARRAGKSSIRPVRDTAKFLGLIVRTVLHFNPLRVFGPLAVAVLAAGVAVAVGSKLYLGQVMDVTSVTLVLAGVQLLAIGLLADLVSRRL